MISRKARLALVCLASVVPASSACAGLFFHSSEGTPPPGAPRPIEHSHARAGNPWCVSPHAKPTNQPGYVGDYVGGGDAWHPGARRNEEGTWGWDYQGFHIPRRIRLSWSHGRRFQGGTGAYRTDGSPIRH